MYLYITVNEKSVLIMLVFPQKPKPVPLTLSVNKEMHGYDNHIILLNYNFVRTHARTQMTFLKQLLNVIIRCIIKIKSLNIIIYI